MPVLRLAEFYVGLSVLELALLKNGVIAILYLTAGTCEDVCYDF